jgi:hypothetical protein
MLGLFFALGLAGMAVGCGSQEGSTAASKVDGKTIKESRKQEFQDLKNSRNGGGASNPTRAKKSGS